MKKHLFFLFFFSFHFAFGQENLSQEIKKMEKEESSLLQKMTAVKLRLEQLRLDLVHEEMNRVGLPQTANEFPQRKYSAMVIAYDEKHEQAHWVAHMVTPQIIEGSVTRSNDFRTDSLITSGTADIKDYWNSGYDRGHLAPSADFRWSAIALSESYFYSNMSPQLPDLNREKWAELEAWGREKVIATGEPLFVVTGGVLKAGLNKVGANEVSVPEQYFKVYLDPDGDNAKAIGFLMPNAKNGYPVISYAVSIDEIEALTGIDFFPNLEKGLQERLESKFDLADWETEAIQDGYLADVPPLRPPLPNGFFNTIQSRLHVGEKITVCGTVVATKLSSKSGATFLNLDRKFPNQVFSATIWKKNRTNFSYKPEEVLLGKKVCITGVITLYQGTPTMSILGEEKIQLMNEEEGN